MKRLVPKSLVAADVRRLTLFFAEVRASLRRLLPLRALSGPSSVPVRRHPSAGQNILRMLPREHPPPGDLAKLR